MKRREALHAGIDIGGTKIAAILLNSTGTEVAWDEVRVRKSWKQKDVNLLLKSMVRELARGLERDEHDVVSVGYGVPGIVTDTGKIERAPNLPVLEGMKLTPVWNDAVCACFAESVMGALRRVDAGVHLTLGTGVGGAVLLRQTHGKLIWSEETQFHPIEIGHVIADYEAMFSDHNPIEVEDFCSRKFFIRKSKRKAHELFEAYKKGSDEEATRLFIQYGAYLGALLASVETLFRPSVISISGGMTQYERAYKKSMMAVFKDKRFSRGTPAKIRISELGPKGGAIGAALYGSLD